MTRTSFMYIRPILAAAVLGLALSAGSSLAAIQEGEVVLRILPGGSVNPILQATQGSAVDSIVGKNAFLVDFPDSVPIDSILAVLATRPGVLQAMRNNTLRIGEPYQISQSFPDQYHQPFLSGLSPTAYFGQATSCNIGLADAHLLSEGGGVTVAVIDNGLAMTHSLFEGRIAPGLTDIVDDDNYPDEVLGEAYGHGTFVSGLVLLAAPDCSILPIRAFDGDGYSSSFYIAMAIWTAVHAGADIINMSFGMTAADEFVAQAVTDAHSAGIIMVAAVGNDSSANATYPAAFSDVIAVSAFDSMEYATAWTNFGPHVDICAPGEKLYSALPGPYAWGTWSGTSFSAPLVAGLVALVKSRAPDAPAAALHNAVLAAARDSLRWGVVTTPSDYYGWGAADALNAVLAWSRGDCDLSGAINVSDLTRLVGFLFRGDAAIEPDLRVADVGCDNTVNIADVTQLVAYMFRGGSIVVPCSY